MLSGACYFRGNYCNHASAAKVLQQICVHPELVPAFWNVFEPVNQPFSQTDLSPVVEELVRKHRSLLFLARRRHPAFLLTIDLRLAPPPGSTPHNCISINFKKQWPEGERKVAQYLTQSILPNFPDYATVPEWNQDPERYKEFHRSYTAKEFVEMLAKEKPVQAPFGPYGCPGDIHWFNYFGRVYVDFIGRKRLMGAGWERVEEIGGGLACYATENLDDPHSRERRLQIANALEEFVWTPGCKRESKRVPEFDFSEQLLALPPDIRAKLEQPPGFPAVHFAGLSGDEQKQAVESLKGEGMDYDPETGILGPKQEGQ